jgi:hypothetical protein
MLKIIEDKEKISREEFEAVKTMAKENYRWFYYIYGLAIIWPIIFLLNINNLTFIAALSVVLSGTGFFLLLINAHPKRYRILYKRRRKT